MHLLMKCVLTPALAALIVVPVFGQLTLDMMPFHEDGLGASVLCMNKGVQKEIRLTNEQRAKIAKIVYDAHAKYFPDVQKARGKKRFQVMRESIRKTTVEARDNVNKALPDILKEEQIKRLQEIELQVNVVQSLNKPDKQKELTFTDKQKMEVKKIADEFKHDRAEMERNVLADLPQDGKAGTDKSTEMTQRTMRLWEAANRKALNILSNEQKRIWKQMTGKTFDFKPDALERFPGTAPRE